MNKKKVIPYSKFHRVRKNLKSTPCFAYRCKKRYSVDYSIEGYYLNGYVYAIFKNYIQRNDRLSTHCMRYWVGDHDRCDLFAYVKIIDSRF